MKNLVVAVFIIVTLSYAETIQSSEGGKSVEVLKSEKEALKLKLESYKLKKKIIEMEKFFEKEKLEKRERVEHEEALMRLKYELKTKRKRVTFNPAGAG